MRRFMLLSTHKESEVDMSEEKCKVKKCTFYGSGSPDECGTQCITCNSWYKNPSEIMRRKIIDLEQQLQAAKEENEKLKEIISERLSEDKIEVIDAKIAMENFTLTQQNKQMMEAINNIKNLCNEDWEDMTVDKFQNQLLQALKGGE